MSVFYKRFLNRLKTLLLFLLWKLKFYKKRFQHSQNLSFRSKNDKSDFIRFLTFKNLFAKKINKND